MLSVKVDKEKETETVEEKKTEIKTKKISNQMTRSQEKNVPSGKRPAARKNQLKMKKQKNVKNRRT